MGHSKRPWRDGNWLWAESVADGETECCRDNGFGVRRMVGEMEGDGVVG